MNREEIEELEEKLKDDIDAMRLIKHIKNLHCQIDRMYEAIEFLEEDIERLKGERFSVSDEDKSKIMDVLDTMSYKDIAKITDLSIFADDSIGKNESDDDLQYIKIKDTQFLLQPRKVSLATRTSSHDVFQITLAIGHKCPHNKSYFVDDDEISIFKEVTR